MGEKLVATQVALVELADDLHDRVRHADRELNTAVGIPIDELRGMILVLRDAAKVAFNADRALGYVRDTLTHVEKGL